MSSLGTVALTHARLPHWAPALVGVMALAAAGLPAMLLGWGVVAWVVLAVVLFLVGLPVWSLVVENRRAATDRLMTGVIWTAFGVAVLPLVWLVSVVIDQGAAAINADFLTYSMRGVIGDEQGGIYHALVGTLLITLAATLISVPVGLLTAIYLVEYGAKSRLARWITFLVDVMTGIPSIVAGLFAFALFALFFGPGIRLGVMGSVALAVLMIPIVIRSAEEILKIVPNHLREASYALGTPKWKTIVKIVLPTALAGLVTGVMLAVARIIGETAPLLVTTGVVDSMNANPFNGRMQNLAVYAFGEYRTPGVAKEAAFDRAWAAALTLIAIVMILNLLARLVYRRFGTEIR